MMKTNKFRTSSDPHIMDDEVEAGARMAVRLFNKWGLSDAESCIILGGLDKTSYLAWKIGHFGNIDIDLRIRLSVIVGIHIGLKHLFTEEDRVYGWVKKSNAHFDGERPIDIMLKGRLADLTAVRDYLNALWS